MTGRGVAGSGVGTGAGVVTKKVGEGIGVIPGVDGAKVGMTVAGEGEGDGSDFIQDNKAGIIKISAMPILPAFKIKFMICQATGNRILGKHLESGYREMPIVFIFYFC